MTRQNHNKQEIKARRKVEEIQRVSKIVLFILQDNFGCNCGCVNCSFICMLSHFSRVRLCATPWTAAHQASPSMGFSRQEHWSGVPLPSPYSLASKVLLKILQARLQQYMNHELPDVQACFRKGRGTREQFANIRQIIEKAGEFQKKAFISALQITPKPLTVQTTPNCGKFLKRWEYHIT